VLRLLYEHRRYFEVVLFVSVCTKISVQHYSKSLFELSTAKTLVIYKTGCSIFELSIVQKTATNISTSCHAVFIVIHGIASFAVRHIDTKLLIFPLGCKN
jgi:hypothetical protein